VFLPVFSGVYFKSRSRYSHAAQKISKTGVGSDFAAGRTLLERNHPLGVLVITPFQPQKCGIPIPPASVDVGDEHWIVSELTRMAPLFVVTTRLPDNL
jgi:hypothetical protein